MPYGVVYMLTNLANGKYYIGQTTCFRKRMYAHAIDKARRPLASSIQKYGWGAFTKEILGEADNQESLDNLERLWIIVSNSIENGYNLKEGGHKAKPSAESRRKMSESQKGKIGHWRGKKRPEMAEQNRRVFTGRKLPSRRILPIVPRVRKPANGGSMPGESNPFWGKKHTPESLAKMSAAQKNKPSTKGRIMPWLHTPEAIEKKRLSLVAYYATEDGKNALREKAHKSHIARGITCVQ